MTYYTRSKTVAPRGFGSLTISNEWTQIELGDDEGTIFETLTAYFEIRTTPPGPVLNPSGKVWYPGFQSRLIAEPAP